MNVIIRAKRQFLLLAGTMFIVLLAELLIFNRSTIFYPFHGLIEQRYTIRDAVLHQMVLKNGRLVPQGANPTITFKNINLPVERVSITCKNTTPGERGRVFFRAANEDFTWANSVGYETGPNIQIIDLPGRPMVSGLRFALTHSEDDVIRCQELVINPLVPFNIRFRRLAVYTVFVLLTTFEIIKKLLSQNGGREEAFPSLFFQRLATPLLAVCLVFPDVVFLGASLRVTDQVQGSHSNFPLMTFYPYHAHQKWYAGLTDYLGAFFQSEPMMEFMVRSLRDGESPYWNPYSAAGSLGPETLADTKFSAFTVAYALLGGGQKTYNLLLLLLYFLAAYFLYRLLREKLQLSFLASLAGILFFLLNGYATANVGSNVGQSYLFTPMCLYASFSFIEKPTALRISGVLLAFAAFFSYTFMPTTLTGFFGLYAVVLGFTLMLSRQTQRSTRWLLQVLAFHATCVFASILLLAFLYFPIGENLQSTDTVDVYSQREFFPLSWIMIPSVFSSSHFFESYWGIEQEVVRYAGQRSESIKAYHFGATALTLAICSISLKKRDVSPFVLICIAAIVIGFGRVLGVPGISSLISKIPIISFMIAERYWWPFIAIPLIPLVAVGVDNIQKRLIRPLLPFLVLALLVPSLLAVGAVYGLQEPNLWYKQWSISLLLVTGVVCALAMALSAYTSHDELRKYVASALVILAFVELTMDSKTMRYTSDDLFTNPPPEVTFLQENVGLYRTLTMGPDFGVRPELGSAFGIQEVTSINLATPSHYMDYFRRMISLHESQGYNYYPSLAGIKDTPAINTFDWGAVDLLGIKYIITPANFSQYRQAFIEHGLIPVLDMDSLSIYENPNILPRAFTIEMDISREDQTISLSPDILSNLEPVDIAVYRNTEVVLKGTVNKPSLLVLTDNWHANWQAFVNDTQTNVLRVDETFRGVRVPVGSFEVRFHYQPRSLNVAFLTSGVILLLLTYILVDHKRIDYFLATHFAPASV